MDVLLAPYAPDVATRGGDKTGAWMSPLKLFEYMAACRPIVASSLPAIREVLEDGVTASLCDPIDPQAWVAAIERILSDREYAMRIAEGAYLKAKREHTWQKRGELILEAVARSRSSPTG
jgi:glycosyltransferase involved in cell wall biosynthesis